MKKIFLSGVSILALLACNETKTTSPSTNLRTGETIFQQDCLTCHSYGETHPNLNDQNTFYQHLTQSIDEVESNKMPKDIQLATEEKTILLNWLDSLSKNIPTLSSSSELHNHSSSTNPNPSSSTQEISSSNDLSSSSIEGHQPGLEGIHTPSSEDSTNINALIAEHQLTVFSQHTTTYEEADKVIQFYCIGCHDVYPAQKGVKLDTYENLKLNIEKAIEEIEAYRMPGYPNAVDPTSLAVLKDWFNDEFSQ